MGLTRVSPLDMQALQHKRGVGVRITPELKLSL